MHCIVSTVGQCLDSLDFALHIFGCQSPSLQVEMHNLHNQSHRYFASQSSSLFWFSTEKLLSMSVSMSPGIIGVHPPLNSTCTMASRRAESKDIVESAIGDTVEQMSMSLPIYEETSLYIDEGIKMKWQRHHREQHN